ncbi:MAG: hypothetical protein PHO32_05505, partial [Candidatus Cloacimonetes bacterium]|nr:hypothetical protein [Candidatus Cloacimonadota bacterium]
STPPKNKSFEKLWLTPILRKQEGFKGATGFICFYQYVNRVSGKQPNLACKTPIAPAGITESIRNY